MDAEKSKELIANKAYNQCSLIIRQEGDEIEVPINFGLTADEIKQIYPFILPLVNQKITNPAIEFSRNADKGLYNDYTNNEYNELTTKTQKQSKYWYDKPEASLLELAIRFAVDIKLRNFDELIYLFSPMERPEAVKPINLTDEEAVKAIHELGLEPKVPEQKDAGDEHDVATGSAGKVSFNLYATDATDEQYTAQLEEMERQAVEDEVFKSITSKSDEEIDFDKYKSTYKSGRYDDNLVKDGRVEIYKDEDESEDEESDDESLFSGGASDDDLAADAMAEDDEDDLDDDENYGFDDDDNYDDDDFDMDDEDIPDDEFDDSLLEDDEDIPEEDDDDKNGD